MRKTLMGVSGIAVALTMIGGATFAAWSDFDVVENNTTAAGHLKLDLNSTGAISNVGGTAIAPGESRTIDFFVASADLDGVPAADLSMVVENLVNNENGCSSTNSEKLADPDCDTAPLDGEFSDESYVRVRYTDPANVGDITFANNSCSAPGGYVNAVGYAPPSNNDTEIYPNLDFFTSSQPLTQLTGDQGICIRIDLGLPPSATNAVQGDSSLFDLRFDLVQA